MTEPPAADTPTGDPHWHQMPDVLAAWLNANAIDPSRVPMWPEIVIHDDGTASVEHIYGMEQNPPVTNMLLRQISTRLVRRPLLVPPDAAMWEAYQRGRADYHAGCLLENMARAGATVLTVQGGAHLVFVSSNPAVADDGFIEEAAKVLAEVLPGVGIQFMTGVDTILHRAPQEER